MLEVRGVSKSYRREKAVDNVSFSIGEGDILGIIGTNGAGKSTFISMIATLVKADSGQILYKGHDILEEPQAIRSELGYVPQDIALYEKLTGIDNLRFWGRSYHLNKDCLEEEIKRVCDIIEFDGDMLKKRVSEYSGGMKRRLNIGVALLHRPKIVLLDEPTAGIDIQSVDQVLEAIRELGEQGTTVIYVGHNMEEVERISSHICIMENGRSLLFGALKELLRDNGASDLMELYRKTTTGKQAATG